jgi:hypothetical protein
LIVLSFLGILSGQLGRIPVAGLGAKEAPLILTDALVAVALMGSAWLLVQERRLVFDRVALFAFLFAAVGGLSTLASVSRFGLTPEEALFSLAYLARWLMVFGLYLVVVNLVRSRDVERIWQWLEAAILVFAGFGVFQAAFLPDFAFLVYPDARPYLDWDPQGHRLVSTLLDPNFAGMLLTVGLLVHAGRIAFGVRVAWWKILLLAVALVLTLSRSSVAAMLAGGALILAVRAPSKRLLAVSSALALGAIASAPLWLPFAIAFNKLSLDDPSGLHRFVQWGWAARVFLDHPLTGVGFNTYGFVHARYTFSRSAPATFGLDGGLIFIAVMTGLVGVVLFGGMLWMLLRTARRGWERTDLDPGLRGIGLGAGALVPAVVVHSLFANSLLYVPLLHVLWALWGCAFVVSGSAYGGLDGIGEPTRAASDGGP